MTQNTGIRPEAELETLLSAALATAFPLVPRDGFTNQMRFTVTLGREPHEVDGMRLWQAEGRADIIISKDGRPLAVVEVKREDKTLTDDDRKQGLSYAALLTPRPPLVIVTNGATTRIYDTASGEPWVRDGDGDEVIAKLFENASKMAAAAMSWAVETLMGPDAGVWASAVRARTKQFIAGQTGEIDDSRKTFASGLCFPRAVTRELREALDEGGRLLLVSGAPLVGKTHVLRELAEAYADSDDFAVFMVREGGGAGLFQRIANVLSAALEWSIEPNDVRQWLRRLSNAENGPALVLAIDGLRAGSALAAGLEELAESGFGEGLRLIAATDDPEALLASPNGRDESALAAIANVFKVDILDDAEFPEAERLLREKRVILMPGAAFAPELRLPWVLRAIASSVAASPRYAETDAAAVIVPCLGVDFVERGRARLARYQAAQRGYRLLARDLLADGSPDSGELSLSRAHTFFIKRDHVSPETRQNLQQLADDGWISLMRHEGGEDIIVPRCPELFVGELSEALSQPLQVRMDDDARAAGRWLGERLEAFFMGDLIGADAIVRMGLRTRGFSSGVIEGLLEIRPHQERLGPGHYALQGPDGSAHDFVVTKDGNLFEADRQGNPIGKPLQDGGDLGSTRADLAGWMILAQLARVPAAAQRGERVDLGLMLEIGTCPFPLIRFHGGMSKAHLVHEIPGHGEVLCNENGIAEPLTAHILNVLATDWKDMDGWVDEAVARNNLYLLSRVHAALLMVRGLGNEERSNWASVTIRTKVGPALEALMNEALGR